MVAIRQEIDLLHIILMKSRIDYIKRIQIGKWLGIEIWPATMHKRMFEVLAVVISQGTELLKKKHFIKAGSELSYKYLCYATADIDLDTVV